MLVSLPGHPPYYVAVSSIVAKAYSNSMLAVLNSRVKVVSNESGFSAPSWNELVQPTGSISSVERERGIVFQRDSETRLSSFQVSYTTV